MAPFKSGYISSKVSSTLSSAKTFGIVKVFIYTYHSLGLGEFGTAYVRAISSRLDHGQLEGTTVGGGVYDGFVHIVQ